MGKFCVKDLTYIMSADTMTRYTLVLRSIKRFQKDAGLEISHSGNLLCLNNGGDILKINHDFVSSDRSSYSYSVLL